MLVGGVGGCCTMMMLKKRMIMQETETCYTLCSRRVQRVEGWGSMPRGILQHPHHQGCRRMCSCLPGAMPAVTLFKQGACARNRGVACKSR